MADPLLGDQQYVIEPAEGHELRLIGTVAGPAGSHTLQLSGVDVALDAADVGVVNSVVVASPDDPSTQELVERLTGSGVFDTTVRVASRVAAGPVRRRGGIDADTARLVIASSTASEAGLLIEERALARLEALVLAEALGLRTWVPSFDETLHRAAADVVGSDIGRRRGSPAAGLMSATICADAAATLTDQLLAARLRKVADELRTLPAARDLARAAAPTMLPAMAGEAAVSQLPVPVVADVQADSLPLLVGETEPTIMRTTNDDHVVRLAGWAGRVDGWWVRVFRSADGVPLGVVPMRSEGVDGVANFVVHARDTRALTIDIVDDPTAPRTSPAVARFRAAIAAGRRAARLERVGRTDAAVEAWSQCSTLHGLAGDDRRSQMAAAIGRGEVDLGGRRSRRIIVDPVVADVWLPGP